MESRNFCPGSLGRAGAERRRGERAGGVRALGASPGAAETGSSRDLCVFARRFTGFMIEGFVESAKLVKFTMEQLAELEETWRDQLAGTNLHELFPRDGTIVHRQEDLKAKINVLRDFKEQMMGLKTAALPVQKGKQTVVEKARARADAKAEQAKTQPASSASAADGTAKKPPAFMWNFAVQVEGQTFKKGDEIKSEKFTLMGVPDLYLSLYPRGDANASDGNMSMFLYAPEGWQIRFKATLEGVVKTESKTFNGGFGWGWADFAAANSGSTEVSVELLEAIPPEAYSFNVL
ncbi:unnamed protein product [Effrenium voratum]|uniref:Uncharacterized protein n=1 Tax=Effrenium voratum TaxID=2562239 RepID=A0AA36I7Q8_9DINO|nr:unnamed protein product [Effrenium voratum]CAJ1425462.1 unnamed protein product [Effrenium voratum]